MKQKAQVTVMIIIGIAFLIAAGLTTYIVMTTVRERGEAALREQQLSAQLVDPVDEYVTGCLSLIAEEGLELIGKQGGLLNPERYVDYNNSQVGFGIVPPTRDITGLFWKDTPDYPWPLFPTHPLLGAAADDLFTGYFGKTVLPPLKKIGEELAEYIKTQIESCTNGWSSFEQQGLAISSGAISADVSFGRSDTTVELNWPIEIASETRTTTLEKFTASIPVRMKAIHAFAMLLADNDTLRSDFELTRASATVLKRVDGRADIIIVKELNYEFSFARQNRPPALHLIDKKEKLDGAGMTFGIGTRVQIMQDNVLNITSSDGGTEFPEQLFATDPDEDSVEFGLADRFGVSQGIDFTIENQGQFAFRVTVTDGIDTDYQEITLQT